jgi:small-conductance mechanosensitive channel
MEIHYLNLLFIRYIQENFVADLPTIRSLYTYTTLLLFSLLFALPAHAESTVSPVANPSSSESSQSDIYKSLAILIEDPKARDKLVQELKSLSEDKADTPPTTNEGVNKPAKKITDGVAENVAEESQAVVQSMITTLQDSWLAISALWNPQDTTVTEWLSELFKISIVISATVAALIILRLLARFLFNSTHRFAKRDHLVHPFVIKTTAIVMATVVDLTAVALAWLAGYGVALLWVGKVGDIDITQTLFLNIFLAVEISKVILRTLFSSRHEVLRILPMNTDTARYWSLFLSSIIGLVGYGTLFVVPFISMTISENLSELVNLLVVLFTVIYGLVVIYKSKNKVRQQMIATAEQCKFGATDVLLRILARTWHWFATIYILVLGSSLIISPEETLPVILLATLKTVAVVLIGMAAVALFDFASKYTVQLPKVLTQHLANADARVNQQLPRVFKILKIVVVLLMISSILDAWHVINLVEWLSSPVGTNVLVTFFSIFFIIAISMLIWIVLASWIEHRLNPEDSQRAPSAREKTLLTIFRNAIAITITIMTTMIVLSEVGLNIGPLIAGAGVIGLAIGFGAQKLVEDVITGIFIQLENAINTGDVVKAGGITGVAEKLTIRSLGLRDLSGTFHIIPFSSVDTVSNFMREFAYHVGEYGVAYREDTDEVIIKLRDAFDELMSDEANRSLILTEELEVHGVTALADSSVNVRVRIKTLPGSQFSIGRAYNRLVKRHLDAAGIEIPFPHLTLYFGEDKDGKAPAAPLRMVDEIEVKELFTENLKGNQSSSKQKEITQGDASTNPSKKGDFDD